MPLTTSTAQQRPRFQSTLASAISIITRLPMARRHQRASTAILLVILFFSCFTIFTHSSIASSTHQHHHHGIPFKRPSELLRRQAWNPLLGGSAGDGTDKEFRFPVQQTRSVRTKSRVPIPPLRLDAAEELAAVIHFITAIPNNAITGVNPDEPIPPELLLDFNIRSGDHARAELDNIVQSTWFEHPVVVFSLVHSPRAREVKKIIQTYKLLPVPVIIEVDERRDSELMTSLLYRLTQATSVPILLIGGRPFGSVDDVRTAHEDGSLKLALQAAGAVIGGSEKKKKKKLVVQFSDEE